MRTPDQLARCIDHALLSPSLSRADLLEGLSLARRLKLWSVCVKPCDVSQATQQLSGSNTHVCSVIAFPHGHSMPDIKVAEARLALDHGATEIDYVVNVSAALAGELAAVQAEMSALNQVVTGAGGLLKVIFETAYLDDVTKVRLCEAAVAVGVAFVKTSTGFAVGLPASRVPGATVADVELMVRAVRGACQVKASGGIRDLATMERFLELGATRIGTSSSATIIAQAQARANCSCEVTSAEPAEVGSTGEY